MQIVKTKFGETHAVISLGDAFKGKRDLELACNPSLEVNRHNEHRFTFREGLPENVACYKCRFKLGLDQEDEIAS